MRRLPPTPALAAVARNCVWFKPAEQALDDPYQLVAHVLTLGRHEDVATLRRHLTDDEMREALDHAPAGVFDARSWAYWNLKLGRDPAPPLPSRFGH